jgi:hypothetical protein
LVHITCGDDRAACIDADGKHGLVRQPSFDVTPAGNSRVGAHNWVEAIRLREHYVVMLIIRSFLTSVFVAGAAAAAIVAAPTAVIANTSATTPHQVVLAEPSGHGSGGGDGQGGGGGCYSGPGWNGCGGWNPAQGGFGSGCVNGTCGGWDGNRGWGNQ